MFASPQISPLVESWPGGVLTACGGSRTAVKIGRDWQKDVSIDQSKCVFETKPQRLLAVYSRKDLSSPTQEFHGTWQRFDASTQSLDPDNWQSLINSNTPFPFHHLLIPRECWSQTKLRNLGGQEMVFSALQIAKLDVFNKPSEHYGQVGSAEELKLGVHVGYGAGQNLGHLHYHLLSPIRLRRKAIKSVHEQLFKYVRKKNSLVLLDNESVVVINGGHRAGQCFFVPKLDTTNERLGFVWRVVELLSEAISNTIELYNKKFLSPPPSPDTPHSPNLPPDYCIGLCFSKGNFIYGTYVPVLNNWGFTEYMGLLERTPLILPWPHEETARFLLKKN